MDTKTLIEKLVDSGVLGKGLTEISKAGATDIDLESVKERVGSKLDPELVAFLRSFDGANLDVVRVYPCRRLNMAEHGLEFADDPAGFVYYVTGSGEVVCEDTDGGGVKTLAMSVTEFIHSYIFGARSREFAGEEWHEQLVRAGITT